jgi:hypothetical protein
MDKPQTAFELAFAKATKKNPELKRTVAIAKASLEKQRQWKRQDKLNKKG